MPHVKTSKYWLSYENDRNTHHGMIFIEIIKRAFRTDEVVMVGHHFVFEPESAMRKLNLRKLNEIPSADTMLFDHDIMTAVFGEGAIPLMIEMAKVPCDKRDDIVRAALAKLHRAKEAA
jgi:hypothetical protein